MIELKNSMRGEIEGDKAHWWQRDPPFLTRRNKRSRWVIAEDAVFSLDDCAN